MSVTVTNTRFVQPFAEVINLKVPKLETAVTRNSQVTYITLHPEDPNFKPVYGVVMDKLPLNKATVEVWHDGFRLVNSTLDFNKTYTTFTIRGKIILFNEPFTEGTFKIYADEPFYNELPEYTINVNNVQGAATKNTINGQVLASYFCEPVVLTEPSNGFVRLTDDRHSLVYVPPSGWEGKDAFSYAIMSDRGQISEPKCVFVTVGEPKEDPAPTEGGDTDPGKTTPTTGG